MKKHLTSMCQYQEIVSSEMKTEKIIQKRSNNSFQHDQNETFWFHELESQEDLGTIHKTLEEVEVWTPHSLIIIVTQWVEPLLWSRNGNVAPTAPRRSALINRLESFSHSLCRPMTSQVFYTKWNSLNRREWEHLRPLSKYPIVQWLGHSPAMWEIKSLTHIR